MLRLDPRLPAGNTSGHSLANPCHCAAGLLHHESCINQPVVGRLAHSSHGQVCQKKKPKQKNNISMRARKTPHANRDERKREHMSGNSYSRPRNISLRQCCHPASPASPQTGHFESCVPALQGWVRRTVKDSSSLEWEGLMPGKRLGVTKLTGSTTPASSPYVQATMDGMHEPTTTSIILTIMHKK